MEQELWQREEKGLIGIVPVRDAAESASVAPVLYPGGCLLPFTFVNCFGFSSCVLCTLHSPVCLGGGTDSGERSLKNQSYLEDTRKADGISQQEPQWHSRYLLCSFFVPISCFSLGKTAWSFNHGLFWLIFCSSVCVSV